MKIRSYLIAAILLFSVSAHAAPITLYPAPASKSPANAAPKSQEVSDPRSMEFNEKGVGAVASKNFVQAEDLFRKALAADSHNLTAAYNLASVMLTLKKEREAIELLTGYTQRYDKDAGLFVRLGDAHFSTKSIPEATSSYEKALALEPNFPELYTKLATVYGLQNRVDDAEKMLLKAVEKNPKDGQALASLSSVYLATGKPQQSVATAKRALQVKPSAEVYVTLGTAYEILKDYKNSLISFQRAVDLGDQREDLKRKIEGLEKVVS